MGPMPPLGGRNWQLIYPDSDPQHLALRYYEWRHNDIENRNRQNTTLNTMTLSLTMFVLCITNNPFLLSVIMLSVMAPHYCLYLFSSLYLCVHRQAQLKRN